MSLAADKWIIDTNVPVNANRATSSEAIPEAQLACVMACVELIDRVVNDGGLVIDAGDEIFDEYRQNLALKGQPGVGDKFMKWVHDYRWNLPEVDRVSITTNGVSYDEFPVHADLVKFDRSDRKFVAVANAHPDRPPIAQATDSKWWGWKEALKESGITVHFLCEELISQKHLKKMGQ